MNKLMGGIFLIIGTCIGASMLALPVTTAPGGFLNASIIIIFAWIFMTHASLLLAEVNAEMPLKTNLISMAKETLGSFGSALTWAIYLILLYSLLSAYIAGGSELLVNLLSKCQISISPQLSALLFTIIFGTIVYKGIFLVDFVNRGLMSGKLIVLILLCASLIPYVHVTNLENEHISKVSNAVMIIFCAFSYGIIIPSIRDYFNGDIKSLRRAVVIGSLIPLSCYMLWIFIVQSVLKSPGNDGLIAMSKQAHAVPLMVEAISNYTNNNYTRMFVHFFTSICILTAFLGVSLSLIDFLSDGLKKDKKGYNKILLAIIAFVPPLCIVLYKPGIFVSCLNFAGIFCVSLLLLMPNLMAFSQRYIKSNNASKKGKPILILNILIASSLIIYGFATLPSN